METAPKTGRARFTDFARQVITGWALFGGLVLIGVVLVNSYSILASALVGRPFPGDFELTEMGAAIAAFCFLPYCQMVGANVSADIFTMRAGPRTVAALSVFAAGIALAFAGIMIWRMWAGFVDYRQYPEFTGILQIPIWWAFVPALVSLVLLFVASLLSLQDALRDMRRTAAE